VYRRCRDTTCSVFWVHADTETTFTQDFKSIAEDLGIAKLVGEELLKAVRERIERESCWLLVLDNADDLRLFGAGRAQSASSVQAAESIPDFQQYVPRGTNGTVLWTSRDQRVAGTLVGTPRAVQVARMEPDEAKLLLESSRTILDGDPDNEQDVLELLAELERLPLAISQAAAYMRVTSMNVRTYLHKLKGESRQKVLRTSEYDRHRRPQVSNSILETWHMSTQHIQKENTMAYNILHTLAFLSSENISFQIIKKAADFGHPHIATKIDMNHSDTGMLDDNDDNENDRDDILRAITRLRDFSFLDLRISEESNRIYGMHKLVQEATRYSLGRQECGHFSGAALHIIADLFPQSRQDSREGIWRQCEMYLAHAKQVGEWAGLCNKEHEVSILFRRVSNYLYTRGRWREMEFFDARAYTLRRQVLGDEHPDTLRSMENLGAAWHAQGRYTEAEQIATKVLDLRRQVLGDEHPDTLRSMENLGAAWYAQGRYTEAEQIATKVLDLRRQVLGDEHPDTIRSMENLGACDGLIASFF
jgi:hypothetical protein